MNRPEAVESQAAKQAEKAGLPDTTVSVRESFGLDVDMDVPAYSQISEQVPETDPDYIFDKRTTMAILSGFANDWRCLLYTSDAADE